MDKDWTLVSDNDLEATFEKHLDETCDPVDVGGGKGHVGKVILNSAQLAAHFGTLDQKTIAEQMFPKQYSVGGRYDPKFNFKFPRAVQPFIEAGDEPVIVRTKTIARATGEHSDGTEKTDTEGVGSRGPDK